MAYSYEQERFPADECGRQHSEYSQGRFLEVTAVSVSTAHDRGPAWPWGLRHRLYAFACFVGSETHGQDSIVTLLGPDESYALRDSHRFVKGLRSTIRSLLRSRDGLQRPRA